MKVAIEEAERVGAKSVYGDVDIDITIQELKLAMMSLASNPISLMQMMNNAPSPPKELNELTNIILTGGNPSQLIEAVKTREQAKQMTKYVSKALPPLYNVMITKRDVHMAKMLRKHCSDGKVVAVVGAGHLEGIIKEWQALDMETRVHHNKEVSDSRSFSFTTMSTDLDITPSLLSAN